LIKQFINFYNIFKILADSKTSFVYYARLFFSLVQRISFKKNQQKRIYYKIGNKDFFLSFSLSLSLSLSFSTLIIIILEIEDINNIYNF